MIVVASVLFTWWTVGAVLTYLSAERMHDAKSTAFLIALTWPVSLLVGLARGL